MRKQVATCVGIFAYHFTTEILRRMGTFYMKENVRISNLIFGNLRFYIFFSVAFKLEVYICDY